MAVPTRPGIIHAAIRDRRHQQPAPGAGRLSHFEQQIVTAVDTAIHAVNEQFVKKVEPLRVQIDEARRKALDEMRPEFARRVQEAGGRTYPIRLLSPTAHVLLFVGITTGELAFNAQVFGLFGEATWMTWLVAVSIGAGLPALAWLLGNELRQATWTRGRAMAWTLALVGVAAAIVGVNHVRTLYLDLLQMDGDDALSAAHPALTFAYLSMNLFIFVAATVVSYASHDPVRRFITARKAVVRAEERILNLEGELRLITEKTRAAVDRLKRWGMCTLMLYRATNRRKRADVPAYFDDRKQADYAPDFVDLASSTANATQRTTAAAPAATNTIALSGVK